MNTQDNDHYRRHRPGPRQHAEAPGETQPPTSPADPDVRLVRVADPSPGAGPGAEVVLVLMPTRAWELTRAAASGRAAVQVVDRVVEVDRPVPVIEHAPVSPRGPAWPHELADLVTKLDAGRVYDRDLHALADALGQVLDALDRRPGWPRHPGRLPLPRRGLWQLRPAAYR